MKSEFPGSKECLIGPLNSIMADSQFIQLCLDIANCIIIVLNKDQTVSLANRKVCEVLGYEADEIIGRNWFDAFVPERFRDGAKDAFNLLFCGKLAEGEYYENPILTRDGRERIISWHNTTLRDEAGNIISSLNSGEDITEHRQAEEALRVSEEKFRILFETSRDAIMLLDRQSFFECNQACVNIYGCTSKEQFVKKHPGEWSPPQQADGRDSMVAAREHIERALQEGKDAFEWTHKRLDGTAFPAEVLLSRSEFGGKTILQAVVRDISDRKLAEERLRESEEKYRNMFQNAVEGMYQTTPEGRILSVNPAQARMFGYASPQEMIDESRNVEHAYYVDPQDRARFIELCDCQGFVEGFEVENYTKDGDKIWISLNARAVKDAEGHVLCYEGITENITKRKLAELAHQDSEQRLSEINEFLPDPMFAIDLDGKVMVWNRAMEDLTGISAKEMLGKGNHEYALPFYQVRRPILIDYVSNLQLPGEPYTLIRKEGDALWAEAETQIQGKRYVLSAKAKPLYSSSGAVIGAIESIWDITDRKLMEEEIQRMNTELQQTVDKRTAELLRANQQLEEDIEERIRVAERIRESESKYREMAELLPEIVYEIDETGRLTFVNSQFFETLGYNQSDIEGGLMLIAMLVPEDRGRAAEALARLMAGETRFGSEYTAQRKDGSTFPILAYSSPIMHQERCVGVRGIAVNITERKRVETELLKMQKLESVGMLAGGIAHDFNNLLAAVVGNIDLARLSLPQEQKNDCNLERARIACLQASELTKRLITFSEGGEPLCREISLVRLITETCDRTLDGSSVQYSFAPVAGLWHVWADEGQLKQVIHHLVLNAREALPDGGTIMVTAENILIDDRTDLPLKHGAYVKFSVLDSGRGISPEDLTKIFDPYFTTKDRGSEKGMGLGLAVCYSVVKRHNGLILAASQPGLGSTFRVYLPAVFREGIIQEVFDTVLPQKRVAVAASGGKILLMDDEEYIRELMRDMLSAFGYQVQVAREGNEAIEFYKQAQASEQPFAAVILDLEIPGGLGGEYVIRRLRELNPGVKAIVASGYSDDPILMEYRSHGFQGAIAKPFTLESLGSVLKEVVDPAV